MDAAIVLSHTIVPLSYISWMYFGKVNSRAEWFTRLIVNVLVLLMIHVTGRWTDFSFYARYLIELIFIASAIGSYLKIRKKPSIVKARILTLTVTVLTFGIMVLIVCATHLFGAYQYQGDAVRLSFPFKHGVYTIEAGGNAKISTYMNRHIRVHAKSISPSVQFAVDIDKLTEYGTPSYGLNQKDITKYPMFDEILYSPCDGEVVSVTDYIKDHEAYPENPPYNSGNTIVIKKDDVFVLLGHLKKGSIVIKYGDKVKTGQPLGRMGNSGATTYPHLHIQVTKENYWGSQSLPILFDGRYPVMNDLFIRFN